MLLKNKKITVGITGGIAAYKIPPLIRLLIKSGAQVRAVMTENATKFITPLTIETLCRYPVARQMFPPDRFVGTHHIDWADWPDLIVIAPATANTMAKLAAGFCDDMLTTVICATKAPIMIAPSMNPNMYENPVTRKNMAFLKSLGYGFIEPGVGEMACESYGPGRMAEPEEIFEIVKKHFEKKKPLKNKKVIVTAGPCREPLDPVRFISNRSSGKMGYALARAAHEAGGEVILVSGPTALPELNGIELERVNTTEEMYQAVKNDFPSCDILIMAAAPGDFRAGKAAPQKIKKGGRETFVVELFPAIDILKALTAKRNRKQKIIGFSLETENGLANAKEKLKDKKLDLIVLNCIDDISPFESDENRVSVIDKKGRVESLPVMSKHKLAQIIIEKIISLR